ncbi:MAG: ribonuclease HII [Candidatus Vogelbacteria bacterium]|nr:ribonuclease HII [Candidatus Vogelbacteria bacterium]
MIKYLIGIDEAGRGPLCGPVAVGAVCCSKHQNGKHRMFAIFGKKGIRDSKKLSPTRREEIFAEIKKLKKSGQLNFAVALVGHQIIDRRGIVTAIKIGIARCLKKILQHPMLQEDCLVLLDGGLRAPSRYLNQRTIIRGDESETVIALASIVAKVSRDRFMVRLAKKYPIYGLEKHKGYGTKAHYRALKKIGHSPIHRLSFLA